MIRINIYLIILNEFDYIVQESFKYSVQLVKKIHKCRLVNSLLLSEIKKLTVGNTDLYTVTVIG